MKKLILDVCAPGDAIGEVARVWKTAKRLKSARISFATPELLWGVLTERRWKLLKALGGIGPVSIREAARRVERDVRGVRRDIAALLSVGLLEGAESGTIEFPYEAIKVKYLLLPA